MSGCEKHGVHSSETSYFACGISVSKYWGHNSSAYFSGQVILSVLFNLLKGQVELKVRQRKEKTSQFVFPCPLCTVFIHQKIHVHDKIHGSLSKSDTGIVSTVV